MDAIVGDRADDRMAGAHDAEVIIVGGGPVGLATAIELGRRGVRTLLVERNERHSQQPRAKTTNARSMAHMRRWGVAGRLREASPLPAGYPTDIIFTTRLFGHHLATIHNAFNGYPDRDERYPEHAQWIPQYKVEGVLRAAVAALPSVTLRFGVSIEGLSQDADGVTVTVADAATGRSEALRAGYVVGADGSRSRVRSLLGVKMAGQHAFAANYNITLRSPVLKEAFGRGQSVMYWMINPDCAAIGGPMDEGDTWYFNFPVPLDTPPLDEATIQGKLNAAFGRDVGAELLVTDPWAAHSLIAERYRVGRAFLAGDACHLHPPFGGYGMNLGIADGVDLGWKLAATLGGWGGEALLDSYEAERRPVHGRVIEEAVANYAVLGPDLLRPGLEDEGAAGDAARAEAAALIMAHKPREFHTLGVVLGYTYSGSPVVVADGSAAPEARVAEFEPSAHPGCLAPHLWLRDGRSLYDLFGAGFTLLVAEGADAAAVAALRDAARERGVPLTVAEPGDARLAGLYGARLALIRPDQHVAWRGDGVADAGAILDRVRGAAVVQRMNESREATRALT